MAVSGQCLLLEDSASFSSLTSPAEEGFPACRVDPVTRCIPVVSWRSEHCSGSYLDFAAELHGLPYRFAILDRENLRFP